MFYGHKEVEFPLQEVVLNHPVDGPTSFFVPADGACVSCVETAEAGFAFIPFDELTKMVQEQENPVSKFFFQARENKVNGTTGFGDQKVLKLKGHLNEEYIEFDGYTFDDFRMVHKGKDPEKLKVPKTNCWHPVLQEWVDVYWRPTPGPLFKLKMGSQEASQWLVGCMPCQLFQEQGDFTMKELASTMAWQQRAKDMLTRDQFDSLLAQARGPAQTSAMQKQQTATARNSQGAGSWTNAVAAAGSQVETTFAKNVSLVRTGGATAMLSKSVSAASLGSGQGSTKSAESVKSKLASLQVGAAAPASESFPLTAQSLKQADNKRGPLGSPFGSPAAKSQRTAGPSRASSAGTLPAALATSFVSAGRVPTLSTGLKLAGKPAPSVSGTDVTPEMLADPELASLDLNNACKFTRAKMRCYPLFGLKGYNMFEPLKNLRKMCTMSVNAMPELTKELECAQHLCEDSTEFTWPKLFTSAWKTCIERANRLVGKESPINDLTVEVWFLYCGRYCLEFIAPKVKTTDLAKMSSVIDPWQKRGKVMFSLQTPSVWSNRFTEEQLLRHGPRVFSLVVDEGLLVPTAKKGKAGLAHLVELAEYFIKKLITFPKPFQDALVHVRQQCFVILLLHGETPGLHQCQIEHLEERVKAKGDPLMAAMQETPVHKAAIDASYSLCMNEREQWPHAKQMLERLQEDGDAEVFARSLLKHHGAWSQGTIRPQALAMLQNRASAFLIAAVSGMEVKEDMPSEQEAKVTALLAAMRQCSARWRSPELVGALQKYIDFSARATSKVMRNNTLVACQNVNGADGIGAEAAENLVRQLPQQDGVQICFAEASGVEDVCKTLQKLCDKIAGSYPEGHKPFLAAGRALVLRVQLDLATAAKDDAKLRWEKQSNMLTLAAHMDALKDYHDSYMGLGDSVESRLQNDPGLARAKKLVQLWKTVYRTDRDESLLAITNQEYINALKETSHNAIKEHGMQHISKGREPLSKASEQLRPVAFGAANGTSWKSLLKDDCCLKDLLAAGQSTILALHVQNFIQMIKQLHTD